MSDVHTATSQHVDQDSHLSAEEKADQTADLKVTLLVFFTLVLISVVTISGWSPQF